jgi:hypothetical protein
MGNAAIQGQLWGARAQDWATYVEQECMLTTGFSGRRCRAAAESERWASKAPAGEVV